MRIQHNIMAMNSYRNLGINQSALAKNLEKLSSGYRINRAGDDAAGLAISEKMRAQITGLDAAQKNVKDGISLVKTAEGAMQEIHDMLGRMKYLATQSANGTYDNEVDRANLQKEVDSLKSEINRIADSANFNGQKLLDGSLAVKENVTNANDSLQDVAIEVVGGTQSYTAAVGKSFTADSAALTGAVTNATNYEAIKFTYTNDKGETKELILSEGNKADIDNTDTAKDIVAALKNNTLTGAVSDLNSKDNLSEFKQLFDVSAGTDGSLTIIAKDPKSGAQVTKMEISSDADAAEALKGDNKVAVGSPVGEKADFTTIKITGSTASIKLNGKTYKVDGAASATAAAADLIDQLQKDGYTVEKGKTADEIKFTDMSQLREQQKGVEITNPLNDKFDVNGQNSTKGKIEFTFNTGVATEKKFTISYVNEKGETVQKTLAFTATAANSTGAAEGLKDAISKDAELNNLFDVEVNAGKVTITSKQSGTNSPHVVGVATNDSQALNDIKTTAPTNKGKTLEMEKDKNILNNDQITIDGKTYQFVDDLNNDVAEGVVKVQLGDDNAKSFENLQKALENNGVKSQLHRDANGDVVGLRFDDFKVSSQVKQEGGLNLQIGDTSDEYNQMTVAVNDMHAEALGIADLDIGTQEGAHAAIDKIMDAINSVSSTRGDLGAIQNRLEHTSNNLGVMKENIQDAESTIRDTDVADEMMKYTKNNILIQASQAMLAQANQVPQGVLQLLQ